MGDSTILFAVTGKSPAILTETIWSLTHETPPIIPDEIIALTTKEGREAIQSQLFDNCIWDNMVRALQDEGIDIAGKLKFGCSQEHIMLFPSADGRRDVNDVLTSDDVASAGDFILRTLRSFTEVPSTQIIASVAGGRKTMGVLLANCMVLLGRKQDTLCHILVQPPYDSPLLVPSFYYPMPNILHKNKNDGKTVRSIDAEITLAYIPFVRVRDIDWSPETAPLNYGQMVARTQQGLSKVVLPEITLFFTDAIMLVADIETKLSSVEFAVIYALCNSIKDGVVINHWGILEDELQALYAEIEVPADARWLSDFQKGNFPDMKEDMRKIISRVRKKLSVNGVEPVVIEELLPNIRKNKILYPAEKIIFK